MKKKNTPIAEIFYHDVERTPFIDSLIHRKYLALYKTCDYISSCRIAIEKAQKHQRGGRPYRVRLDITVPPGHELVVKKEQSGGDSRSQLNTIIKDAFISARRQLEALKEKQHGNVKTHAQQ